MEKKIKIIMASIILLILIIALIVTNAPKKEKEKDKDKNTYVCTYTQNVAEVDIITTFYVHFDKENIKTIDVNKIYKGNTTKAKDGIANYRYIIGVETEQYSKYPGIKTKINKDSKKEYNYTYTFDVTKIDENLASLFGVHTTVNEQNEYFKTNNYVCE